MTQQKKYFDIEVDGTEFQQPLRFTFSNDESDKNALNISSIKSISKINNVGNERSIKYTNN